MRVALALFLLMCASTVARADDTFRCGDNLVSVGENQQAVLAKCGPPSSAERKPVRWRAARAGCVIESWTYDRGSKELVRVLSFEDGLLEWIDVGDYGH